MTRRTEDRAPKTRERAGASGRSEPVAVAGNPFRWASQQELEAATGAPATTAPARARKASRGRPRPAEAGDSVLRPEVPNRSDVYRPDRLARAGAAVQARIAKVARGLKTVWAAVQAAIAPIVGRLARGLAPIWTGVAGPIRTVGTAVRSGAATASIPLGRGRRRLERIELPDWLRVLVEAWRRVSSAHRVLLGARTVSLAFAGAGVCLIVLGLRSATLALDSLGIASSLPTAYYAGMFMLLAASGVALLDRRRGAWMLAAYGFVYGLLVWLTPLALEGTPHFRTSYQNFGYVDPILRGIGLVPGVFLYHDWPLFPLGMAAFIQSTGISSLTLLAWYPTVMVLLYAAVVVAFVAILGRRLQPGISLVLAAAVAVWSYFVFNWTGQEYFSPQSLAYLFFLILLCVLAWSTVERDGQLTPRLTVAVLGLFTLIVATHVLTALVSLGVLLALLVTGHIKRGTILITCGLIFIVWQVTIAAPFFVFYGSQLMSSVLGATNFLGANVEGRVRGDAGHILITELRILGSAVPYGLAGVALLAIQLKNQELRAVVRRRRLPQLPQLPLSVSFPVAALLGIVVIGPVSVYGGEMLIRVLFFSLPALCALIAFGLQQRWFKALVLATVVVMAPVHLLTQDGNELLDYVSSGELAGFDYMASLGPANVFGGFPVASTYNTIRFDARNAFVFSTAEPTSLADYADPWLHHTWIHKDWPLYVVVSRGDNAAMTLFTGQPDFITQAQAYLDQSAAYVRVYSNPDIAIYLWRPSAGVKPAPSDSMASGAYAETKGSPPWPLVLLCMLGVLLAVAVELCASLAGRVRAQVFAARMKAPSVCVSVVVIAVSGYHIATLIGLLR